MRLTASAIISVLLVLGCGGSEAPPPPPPPVTVSISGASSVEAGGQIQFTAAVANATDHSVVWAATAGTIDENGLFRAPTTLGEVQVKATTRADYTKTAVAQVTVIAKDISAAYAEKFDVIVDPYAINPLSAVVNVRGLPGSDVASIKVTVQDGPNPPFVLSLSPTSRAYVTNYDSSDVVFAEEGVHVPVVGLFADATNHVDVVVETKRGERLKKNLTIVTRVREDSRDDCRTCYPNISVAAPDPTTVEPGWTLVELSLANCGSFRTRPIAFDTSGRLRWMLKLDDLGDWIAPISESMNGNILTGRFGSIYEFNRLGRVVRRIEIPGFAAHHEVLEMTDGPRAGNLLVAVDELGAPTVEDRIIEVNRAAGRVVNKWDLTKILDPSRNALGNDAIDWLHNNGIAYSAVDDTIVISGRNQGVAKIDQAGQLKWLLAPHRGWQGAQAARLLAAVDESGRAYADQVQEGTTNVSGAQEFDWPWGQHSPHVLDNGNVMVFDNGYVRNFGASPDFSRAVIYDIDETAMTVRQIWQYGADRGANYFSIIISSVNLLPTTQHLLVQPGVTAPIGMSGSAAIVSEVNRDGALVFEALVQFANERATGTGWGQFDMSYRAHRMTW